MLNAVDIKRQIIAGSDGSIVKKQMDKNPPGISTGEMIEVGNELERMTKTGGWTVIEQYMLAKMNLVGLAVADGSDINRGIAKAFIELMQWIDLTIKRKNKLLEEERLRHATKNVPKDEEE